VITSRDLGNPDEIADLVKTFYARVAEDDLLAPVFVGQAAVEWDHHLPKIIAFWCKVELGLPGYYGAPTPKHAALSAVTPFRAEQFARWVGLFHDTVDRGWEGPHAESIKARAVMIAKAQSRIVPNAEPWDGPRDVDGPRGAA
jgi:hemoglobin